MWWVAQNFMVAALLAGCIWLAAKLFRPSPAVQHALWLIVLIKLLTPPFLVSPAPLPATWRAAAAAWLATIDPAPLTRASAAIPIPGDVATRDPVTIETVLVLRTPGDGAEMRSGSADTLKTELIEAASPAAPRWASIPRAFFGVWLLGTAAVAAIQLWRIVRLRSALKNGTPVSARLTLEISDLSAALGIRPPAVVCVPGVKSPMVWACLRPMLVWPAGLEDCLPPASRRAVLLHELAHLRRRDHWVGWLELLAGCAWWWNPLFWYVRSQMRDCAELACDAWVTATLPAARRDYAEALIEVSQRLPVAAVPTPAMSLGRAARHTFERRLTMILRERVPNKMPPAALAAVVLLGLVVIPAWSIGQEALEPPACVPAPNPVPQPRVTVEVTETPARIEATPVIVQAPVAPATPAAPVTPAVPVAPAAAPAPALPAAVPTPPVPAAAAMSGDSQRRLKILEDQIARLQAEIKALRGGATTTSSRAIARPPAAATYVPNAFTAGGELTLHAPPGRQYAIRLSPRPAAFEVQTLSRGTYKLPQAKAEALAAFLREHLSDNVDVKVQGDSLVVTTTPETQSTITQFVELFQKPAAEDGQAKPGQPDRSQAHPGEEPFRAPAPAAQPSEPAPRR